MNFSFLELFVFFGGALGIILAISVLFSFSGKKTVKISMAAVILVTSLMIILGALNFSGKIQNYIHLLRVESPIHLLFGPATYFYAASCLNAKFKFKKIHLLHLLPFLLNAIWYFPFYIESTQYKLLYYETFKSSGSIVIPIQYLIKTISGIVYFIAQLYLAKKYNLFTKQPQPQNKELFYWLNFYFLCQFLLLTGLFIDHLTGLSLFKDPYCFAVTMVTVFLYLIVLGLFFSPRLLYGYNYVEKTQIEKYANSNLDDGFKNEILEKLEAYMKLETKPYLETKLSLQQVATDLSITKQELSQIVNEKVNMNFNDYINSYRIEEAKNMLTSSSFKNITIDAIAQKSGFHSKSAFYNSFKKQVGVLPKEYARLNQL